jgi:hypothetical protein
VADFVGGWFQSGRTRPTGCLFDGRRRAANSGQEAPIRRTDEKSCNSKVIEISEANDYMIKGWEYVAKLSENKVLIKTNAICPLQF